MSTHNIYREDGLIKQSYSITTASGRKLHIISYFTKKDANSGRLMRVSKDPRFVGEGGGEWNLRIDENEYKTDLTSLTEGTDLVFNSTSQSYSDHPMEEEDAASNVEIVQDQVRLTPVIGRQRHGSDEEDRRRFQLGSPGFFSSHSSGIERYQERSHSDTIATSQSHSSGLPRFLNHHHQQQQGQPSYFNHQHLSTSWTQSPTTVNHPDISSDPSRNHSGSNLPSSRSLPSSTNWSSSSSTSRNFNSGMPAPIDSDTTLRHQAEDQESDAMDVDSNQSHWNRERGTTITQRPRSLMIPNSDSSNTLMAGNDSMEEGEDERMWHTSGSDSSLSRPRPFRTFSSHSHRSQPQSSDPRYNEDNESHLHRTHSLGDRSKSSTRGGSRNKRSAGVDHDYSSSSRSEDVNLRPSYHQQQATQSSSSRSPSPVSQDYRHPKAMKTTSGSNSLSSLNSGGLTGNFSTTSFRSLTSNFTTPSSSSANQSTASLSPSNSFRSVPQHQNQRFPFRSGSEERWKSIRERESSDYGSELGGAVGHHGMGMASGSGSGLVNRSPTLSVGSMNDLQSPASSNLFSSQLDVTNSLFRLRTRSSSEKDSPYLNRISTSSTTSQDQLPSPSFQRSSSGVHQQVYSRSPTSSLALNSLKEQERESSKLSTSPNSPPSSFNSHQRHRGLVSSSQDSALSSNAFRKRPGFSPYSVPSRSASDNDVLNRLDTRL